MKKEDIKNTILFAFIIVEIIVIIILVIMCNIKNDYLKYYDEYCNVTKVLDEELVEIYDIRSEINYYENNMLDNIMQYYEDSDDEAFRKVFKERILEPDEDRTNEEYLSEIYAFLNAYPKMMTDKEIGRNYISATCSKKDLQDKIYNYNKLVETYLELIDNMNSSDYVVKYKQTKITVAKHSYITNLN